MRKAEIFLHEAKAGTLSEVIKNQKYIFEYDNLYSGPAVSVTMSVDQKKYEFDQFPPFFEGLLPEGANLEMLLRTRKIDHNNLFDILLAVGNDTVGAVTVKEAAHESMSNQL